MSAILAPTLDELSVEFEKALAIAHAADAACIAAGEPHDLGLAYDRACDAMAMLCGQIAELRAQNIQHVRLKARALEWLDFADGQEPAPAGERLAFQIVRAIVYGVPS